MLVRQKEKYTKRDKGMFVQFLCISDCLSMDGCTTDKGDEDFVSFSSSSNEQKKLSAFLESGCKIHENIPKRIWQKASSLVGTGSNYN